MKTIYLVRHSIPEQTEGLENAKIPLSIEGVKKAETFKKKIIKKFDRVYSSPYLRAVQTAKIISDSAIIINDLNERIIGNDAPNDYWEHQYLDYDYKLDDGESIYETRFRMKIRMNTILHEMQDGETIVIVSHATAIGAYLLTFCSIEVIDSTKKIRKICHNNKVILEGIIKTPSAFVLHYTEDNELVSIEYQQ